MSVSDGVEESAEGSGTIDAVGVAIIAKSESGEIGWVKGQEPLTQ